MTDAANGDTAEEIIYLDDGWKKIETVGIKPFLERVESFDTDELDTKPNPMQEFLSTYDCVFQMCIQREPYNYSDRLYNSYQDSFSKYFKNHFIPSLRQAKAKSELEFLNEFARRWQQNQYAVLGMQRMFCYLDRFYVPNNEDLLGMKEYGYSLYKDIVFEQFHEDARDSILKCIKAERDGVEQNRELLRSCVMVFVNLGNELRKVELKLYKENFQSYLLKDTIEYYKVASEKWLSTLSCPEYLLRAEEAIEQELGRLNSFLHNSSEEDLMREVRVEILANHQDQLLNSPTGIVNMLEDNKSEDLSRLFNLYSDVDKGLIPVATAMQQYICKLGDEYITESKEEKSKEKNSKHVLIQNLIALHDRFLKIVKNEFKSHREFTKAMKDAFEKFINEEYYTSNYLARYVNDFFRKGGIGQNFKDDELDQQMLHIVMLYGYIRDKDVFETNYQAYLASRLLSDSSASEQNEKKMIGKLKQESGYHWTQKLEDMFTDIQRSKELMKVFNRAHQNALDLQMNVAICTQGAWPSTTIPKCVVPTDLENAVDRFTNFYEGKHVGRKLQFRWDKGTAELSVRFNAKCEKVLVVTTYQMMVLLLFNHSSGPVLTYQQILDGTGISGSDLKPALLSLAHPKSKVLMKRPNGPKLEPEHKLRLNFKFSHPQSRIHVPMLKLAKQQKQENMETQSQITVQRKHQVDAAIVRIMKARKQLNHAVLVSDVRNQLQARFDAQPALIKSRIESLINLEYLERDPDNRTTYLYKQ
jgi:cullin 1